LFCPPPQPQLSGGDGEGDAAQHFGALTIAKMIAKTNLTAVGFFAQRGALFGALVNSRRGRV
jgi:hypothetical protein